MIGDNGNAPDHEQNGRQLAKSAWQARHARDETGSSPVERENIRRLMQAEWPEVLDDSDITQSAKPQTAEREMTRSPCSFDL